MTEHEHTFGTKLSSYKGSRIPNEPQWVIDESNLEVEIRCHDLSAIYVNEADLMAMLTALREETA